MGGGREEVPALALEMAEDRAWDQAQDQAWVEVWEAWEQGVLVYPWAEDQCLQQDQDQDQCPLQDQDQILQQGQDLALDQNLLLDQVLQAQQAQATARLGSEGMNLMVMFTKVFVLTPGMVGLVLETASKRREVTEERRLWFVE